ncbi:hypothetical protein DW085_17135 [Clostridium sp. AF50-3]|nr:hypothetical protein DW085_17135 [Clostridium sp. AF50-3]
MSFVAYSFSSKRTQRFIGISRSIGELYHKYNDSQKKVCYDTDINNKGQKNQKENPGKEKSHEKEHVCIVISV